MAKKALYTHARFYYMNAYRERMKTIRSDWTTAQRNSTLLWMWSNVATQNEREECEGLHGARSPRNTFVADDARIPEEVKAGDDPVPEPVVAGPDLGVGGARAAAGPDDAEDGAAVVEDRTEAPARAETTRAVTAIELDVEATRDTRVNTTSFHYMPDMGQMDADLPSLQDAELNAAQKRKLLDAGIGDPDRESPAKRWRGVHFLGAGATGNCSLWVKTNETDYIEERLAVRDIATMHQNQWVNPINWRDRLPREIAIMRRLDEQGGSENNMHRYYGHRIDAGARRYRIYTEVCDLGNLENALQWYSRQWRRRRHLFKWSRWLKTRPQVEEARANREEYSPGALDTIVQDTMNEVWQEYEEAKRQNPEKHEGLEFDDMSDIEEWRNDELGETLPPVIPEAFLWHVFDQLAGAALILQKGAEPFVGEKKWKEIVHKDMHTRNIFLKPAVEGFFGSNSEPDPRHPEEGSFARFKKSEYPDVVLADFDTSFFDLQDDGDAYQDNPIHYMISRDSPEDANGGRYPPEAFWPYQHRPGWTNLTKLTSATDVWGIGQIMWNLAMNLPYHTEYIAPFYDDAASHTGVTSFRRLNNGQPYSAQDLNKFLMTGDAPFEAAKQYSPQLRQAIRKCLLYHPRQRIKIAALKAFTKQYRDKYMDADGAEELVVRVDGRLEGFGIGRVLGE